MDIRYSANPNDVKRYTTEELRREFHISGLYQPDSVQAVYSHVDRMVALGVMPVSETVPIDKGIDVWKNFGTRFFLERREAGLFNLGGPGTVTCDGREYSLGYKDCLYITMGTKEVAFASDDGGDPAKFYVVSAPAHRACETRLITRAEAAKKPLDSTEGSNKRVINRFIHPAVLPAFDAVISPSWSIHAGCGTSNYTFIWAMGGENQAFDDMDVIPAAQLK